MEIFSALDLDTIGVCGGFYRPIYGPHLHGASGLQSYAVNGGLASFSQPNVLFWPKANRSSLVDPDESRMYSTPSRTGTIQVSGSPVTYYRQRQ